MWRTGPNDVGARDLAFEDAAVDRTVEAIDKDVFDLVVDDRAHLYRVLGDDGLVDDPVEQHHVLPVGPILDLVHPGQLRLLVFLLLKHRAVCVVQVLADLSIFLWGPSLLDRV